MLIPSQTTEVTFILACVVRKKKLNVISWALNPVLVMQVHLKIFITPKIDIASMEVPWGNGIGVGWIIIDHGSRKKKVSNDFFSVFRVKWLFSRRYKK